MIEVFILSIETSSPVQSPIIVNGGGAPTSALLSFSRSEPPTCSPPRDITPETILELLRPIIYDRLPVEKYFTPPPNLNPFQLESDSPFRSSTPQSTPLAFDSGDFCCFLSSPKLRRLSRKVTYRLRSDLHFSPNDFPPFAFRER